MNWLKRVWPISALKRRYDTFVARLETEVIFKSSSALEESFSSAREKALSDLEKRSASVRKELDDAATGLKRTVYTKAGELRDGLKETREAADAATASVQDFSSRLSVVESEYKDVKVMNGQNKEIAGRAAATLAGAKANFESAEKKHLLALSAAETAGRVYGEAHKEREETKNLLTKLSNLQERIKITLEEIETSRKNLDEEFNRRQDALLNGLREQGLKEIKKEVNAAYFLGMPAEQKQLLVEFAVNFSYDLGKMRQYVEDLRRGVKGKQVDMVAGLQKLYLNSKLLDLISDKASSEGAQIGDFAREGVDTLRKRDPDFEQRYQAAERFKQELVKEARQKQRK